jgi:diguanylate cyclase (GGDEF)-like protein
MSIINEATSVWIDDKPNRLAHSEMQHLNKYQTLEKNLLVNSLKDVTLKRINEILDWLDQPGILNDYLYKVGLSLDNTLPDDSESVTIPEYTQSVIQDLSNRFSNLEFINTEFVSKDYIVNCNNNRWLDESQWKNKDEWLHIFDEIGTNWEIWYMKLAIWEDKFIYSAILLKNKKRTILKLGDKTDLLWLHNYYRNHSWEIIKSSENIESKYIDPLTNIHNVWFAQKLLNKPKPQELSENDDVIDENENDKSIDKQEVQHNYSFIFFDVADFKHINDVYGHVVWDYILSEMWSVIRKAMRPGDYPVRVWWDEMWLIIDNWDETDPAKIKVHLEKIQERINKELKQINISWVDVSIVTSHAISTFDNSKSLEELKAEADDKLVKWEDGKRHRAEEFVWEGLSELWLVVLLNDLIAKYDRIPALMFGILMTQIERLTQVDEYKTTNPDYLLQIWHTAETAKFITDLANGIVNQNKKN